MSDAPVTNVILIHGYSETSLGAYYQMPELLAAAGFGVGTIVLSAFDSLDDHVTVDDLAAALEERMQDLEAQHPGVLPAGAIVCHSTGALVARRWLLNRFAKGRGIADQSTVPQLPARLITMAGANHGSSLAQIGKSPIGYLQKLIQDHQLTVGRRVLTDLDYGSDFLLRLNREWLAAWNDAAYPLDQRVLAFSLGGDYQGSNPLMYLFWGTCELGSDNTVRMSAANLNYSIVDGDVATGALTRTVPKRRIPHRIMPGYSHYDSQTGIMHAPDAGDAAFVHLLQALQTPAADYDGLATAWDADNAAWLAANGPEGKPNTVKCNATVIFNVSDRSGTGVPDCMIAFWDQSLIANPQGVGLHPLPATQPLKDLDPPAPETPAELAFRQSVIAATLASSNAILPNSPIQNDANSGSYSFYINQPDWRGPDSARKHTIYIEALSDSSYIGYTPVMYQTTGDDSMVVQPHECTYVFVTLDRDSDQMLYLYQWDAAFNLAARQAVVWRPFAPGNQVPKRP
jgi:hypothetical protein